MNNENARIKIAYLTGHDPRDKMKWSGTTYCMAQSLQKHCGDITYIGPIDTSKEQLIGKILDKCSRTLFKKTIMYRCSFLFARKYAEVVSRKLAEQSFDVVITAIGATEIALLKTDIPIVFIDDATFNLLHNYYPMFSNILGLAFYQMNKIEQLAFDKASLLIFSSNWAARSAIEDYHIEKQKVRSVPFGANFENTPSKEIAQNRKRSDQCKLLFVGVEWDRKGGNIAFETLLKLEEIGIKAELTVCGCTPPNGVSHERMTIIPFLKKNDEKQQKELEKLFITSDFLLLPTRNDCTPIVFNEANAFGLPVVTTDTGGVAEIIKNGENGFVLPLSARGSEYAELIAKTYRDEKYYAELVRSSRDAFEERLNWDAWGTNVKSFIVGMLLRRSSDGESA